MVGGVVFAFASEKARPNLHAREQIKMTAEFKLVQQKEYNLYLEKQVIEFHMRGQANPSDNSLRCPVPIYDIDVKK